MIGALIFVIVSAMPTLAALEDPTRPPAQAAAVTTQSPAAAAGNGPRWTLTSTLVSPSRRTAVINDQVVAVGDRVDGALVADIQADSVRLRAGGREVTLTLLKTNVKQPSKPQSFKPQSSKPKQSATP